MKDLLQTVPQRAEGYTDKMHGRVQQEFRQIVSLAVPVVVAELGWVFMSVVDTIMAGRLGPLAIASVSLGSAGYEVLALAGIGLVLGLDTVVSQAFGAGRLKECDDWLWQGLYVAAAACGPLLLGIWATPVLMRAVGVGREIVDATVPFLGALGWSLPPLLAYATLRRYLQGMSVVRPVMFTLISANVVNAAGNWVLMQHYGVEGIAWSTCLARIYMAVVLAVVAVTRNPSLARRFRLPDRALVTRLLRLGLPASGQMLLEVGVFGTATVLAGKLTAEALAAHQVAVNIAATTYMVPLGVSSAAAVAVGQAIGRGDPEGARRAGWLSLALGAGFMSVAALVLLAAPGPLVRIFTRDAGVLSIAIPLMLVAALFQVFDGIQVVATGVLRGAGNTRLPMAADLVAHWMLGLPAGYVLCFVLGWGVRGIWIGLSIGLMAAALLLVAGWWRMGRRGLTLPH
jgi:MATE family multidrug resistance protein